MPQGNMATLADTVSTEMVITKLSIELGFLNRCRVSGQLVDQITQ